MKNILIIDNYDSFTYNLVQMVEEIVGHEIDVIRNDDDRLSDLSKYDYIILSPGPGIPEEAGHLKEVIRTYGGSTPIFGVCLGLQAIGEVYGATLKNLAQVWHGRKTEMYRTDADSVILNGIDNTFMAGRYHSWVVDHASDTSAFVITAEDDTKEIMAMEHREHPVYGVQFHPESIMTPEGKEMLRNFLKS